MQSTSPQYHHIICSRCTRL